MTPDKKPIYILHGADEMRHPYETALKGHCSRVVWFRSLKELTAAGAEEMPVAVLIDLDTLNRPIDSQLEHIRTTYADSDLLAISAEDSAKLALQCINLGFSDFLVKPVSPEEVAWSVRKSRQKQEILAHIDDPRTTMVRAVQQISSSGTPTLVRLSSLNYLQKLTGAKGAAWIQRDSEHDLKILCSVPKGVTSGKILANLPAKENKRALTRLVKTKRGERRLLLRLQHTPKEQLLLWGIPSVISAEDRSEAMFLVEHAEISLMNLRRLEEIKAQTFVDDLTGLYNSRYLKFALTNAVMKCKKPGQGFTVLFIDVDHFKKINDSHGHLIGSEFLVTIGKTIRNTVRAIDPVFRYGGDEFVVLLNDTHTEGAKVIAERIRKNIERRVFVIHQQRIQTTVSIGLASYPEHAAEQESLLKLADEALYSAKKASRNSVHLAVETGPSSEKEQEASK